MNIGGANMVILKWPTAEEEEEDQESYAYPITAVTRSQNQHHPRFLGLKILNPPHELQNRQEEIQRERFSNKRLEI